MGVWSLLLNGKFFWVAWSWMNLHPVPRSIVCSVWVAQHALLRSLPSLSILINRWLERVRSLLANGVWHLHATRIYRVRILIVTPAEQTSRHFKAEMRRASVKREDWQLQSRMEHHSSNRWQFPPSAVQWQANLFGASDGFDTRWTDWVAASSLKPLKKNQGQLADGGSQRQRRMTLRVARSGWLTVDARRQSRSKGALSSAAPALCRPPRMSSGLRLPAQWWPECDFVKPYAVVREI